MDTNGWLEQLMASGKELAGQGRDFAEDKLNLPEDEQERAATVGGLKKGAAIGGVLALLLGTRVGRRVAGPLAKYGTLAALGTVAYKAYKGYQAKHQDAADPGTPIGELAGAELQTRSQKVIRAMIAAAKADGHIDGDELANIKSQIEQLDLDDEFSSMLQAELDRPLDAKEIAAASDSPSTAAEMYLASLMVVDSDNEPEREYLDQLARELGLSNDLAYQIELAAGT